MNKKKRRIEKKSSRTAAFTCVSRAASFYETSQYYKSNDEIAPKLLPKFVHLMIKSKRIRAFIIKKFFPKGIYEYVIARTKVIDDIFSRAIAEKFDQILLFGAGFDSRSIRLVKNNDVKTKIFELDVNTTISDKLKQYNKRNIDPGETIFVKIDFNTENIDEKMKEAGFQYDKKTLYILEGITMYLNEVGIDMDFKFIAESAGMGSIIVFDYIYQSVLNKQNLYHGEEEIYQTIKKSGEGWTYGIVEGDIENFLQVRDLKLVEHLNYRDLEEKFFQDENNNIIGKVNGTHCIVLAKIKGKM
ncbi:MAG: class I SAM-dependent methyltransferase [Promethearchaeota archaeon]